MRHVVGIVLIAAFIFYVLSLVSGLFIGPDPEAVGPVGRQVLEQSTREAGAVNTVTSVVVFYRGFDTLGEVTVLFLSALGIAVFFRAGGESANRAGTSGPAGNTEECGAPGFILRTGARILYPFFFLFGIYIIVHGHLSPGGGFPGGVIIATGFFVAILTGDRFHLPEGLLTVLEGFAGLSFIGLGLAGLFSPAGSFLANILPLGSFGTIFSAGILPLLYAVVGVKVAAELSGAVGRIYLDPEPVEEQ
ncbi:MAG: hypothetical protein K9L68_12680 [Spirochaetales bacterium]|nr:hypothetical protein [Spirochaetales bacterium]MCF7939447.1 hypothetical protein [Spirochaetales bacterium]